MQTQNHCLRNARVLVIREADGGDAGAVLNYIEGVSGESDFLSFGPGEFELSLAEEEDFLRAYRHADNQLCLLGLINEVIVSTLHFSAGRRPRMRHTGEFGMSVRKAYWGLGIGSLMLDALVHWAREGNIIKKINLRVRTDNERAIELYQRKAFTQEGTIRRDILVDGIYHDHHWMGLEP